MHTRHTDSKVELPQIIVAHILQAQITQADEEDEAKITLPAPHYTSLKIRTLFEDNNHADIFEHEPLIQAEKARRIAVAAAAPGVVGAAAALAGAAAAGAVNPPAAAPAGAAAAANPLAAAGGVGAAVAAAAVAGPHGRIHMAGAALMPPAKKIKFTSTRSSRGSSSS